MGACRERKRRREAADRRRMNRYKLSGMQGKRKHQKRGKRSYIENENEIKKQTREIRR